MTIRNTATERGEPGTLGTRRTLHKARKAALAVALVASLTAVSACAAPSIPGTGGDDAAKPAPPPAPLEAPPAGEETAPEGASGMGEATSIEDTSGAEGDNPVLAAYERTGTAETARVSLTMELVGAQGAAGAQLSQALDVDMQGVLNLQTGAGRYVMPVEGVGEIEMRELDGAVYQKLPARHARAYFPRARPGYAWTQVP